MLSFFITAVLCCKHSFPCAHLMVCSTRVTTTTAALKHRELSGNTKKRSFTDRLTKFAVDVAFLGSGGGEAQTCRIKIVPSLQSGSIILTVIADSLGTCALAC